MSGTNLPWPARYDDKPAVAVLDYGYDFGPEINANEPTDTVTSVSLSIAPNDLGASMISVTPAGLVTFWLSGGSPGVDHAFNIAVATAGGRVLAPKAKPRILVV